MSTVLMPTATLDANATSMNNSNSSVQLSPVFVDTVLDNFGLCIVFNGYLNDMLTGTYCAQVAITILGIIGSALTLKVSCLPSLRSSLSVQVALLAVYNLLYLHAVFLLAVFYLCDARHESAKHVFLILRRVSQWGETYTILDITAERCLSIVKPFFTRKVCSVRFTLKRAGAILGFGVAFTVPFALDLINGYSKIEDDCQSERKLTTFGLVYTLYISLFVGYLLPFLSVMIVNVVLVAALLRLDQREGPVNVQTNNTSGTHGLSVFVLALSVWYCVCMVTPTVYFLVRLTRIELFQPKTDVAMAAMADTLIVLSACANFFFYFLLWRNFRQAFDTTFCGRCHGRGRMRVSDLNSVEQAANKHRTVTVTVT